VCVDLTARKKEQNETTEWLIDWIGFNGTFSTV